MPFGEVLTVPQVASCDQHLARGFLRPAALEDTSADSDVVPIPGPFCRFGATPCPPPRPPGAEGEMADEVLAGWAAAYPLRRPDDGVLGADAALAGRRGRGPPPARRRAGARLHPRAGRSVRHGVLGDLGADIVKLQTESRSQGAHANDFPYFAMWNRNKRSVTLDVKHPGALDVFRGLVEQADVVIDNFSAGVLATGGRARRARRVESGHRVGLHDRCGRGRPLAAPPSRSRPRSMRSAA